MAAPPTRDDSRLSRAQWYVLLLLAVSIFINYIDRGNLSIAAPLLKDELRISPARLGILLSSFFWTYPAFSIVSGWLVDRFNVNWIMAAGFFLWSAATIATGFAHGFALLLVMRLILGIGESVAYPSYSNIIAKHIPGHHRGLANSLIAAGFAWGPAVGILFGGLLTARFGWRPFFIGTGLITLVWLFPWFRWMPRGPGLAVSQPGGGPGIWEILCQRSAWGTFIGLFFANYFVFFLLTWLPFYLVRARNFSMDGMAVIGALAYFALGVSATICGWLSDRWIASGGSPTRVRKTFVVVGLVCSTVIFPVALIADRRISMALLFLACTAFGLYCSNHWAISQTLAGLQAAGKWTGLQNSIANLAGIIAPALTGFIVSRTGSFIWAFAIAAVAAFLGAIAIVCLIGPVQQLAWKTRAATQDGRQE